MLYSFGDIFRMGPFEAFLIVMSAIITIPFIAFMAASDPNNDFKNVSDSWIQAKEVYEQCLEEAPEGVFCLTEVKKSYWLSVDGVNFIRGIGE